MKKKILALFLAAAMTMGFAGCNNGGAQTETTTAAPDAEANTEATTEAATEATTEAEQLPDITINVGVLAGPTGVGAAKLMNDSKNSETAQKYNFTVETENANIVAAVSSGELDIAAIATNVASNLYNKTEGGVQIIALNTLGVLYILENGNTVNSIADLEGKTIIAPGQGANPEYVLRYLLEQNGVNADIQFMTAEEVTAKMVSGEATLCMLPVPAATAVQMKNPDVHSALDLTVEWDKLNNGSTLTMGAVIVRKQFAEEHPEAVKKFLEEYTASIEYVKSNVEDAAQLVADFGITANAQIAAKAIPQCNLVAITGAEEIKAAISGYYEVLFAADPKAVGGKIPGEDFFFAG